jgi:hypothetical protein
MNHQLMMEAVSSSEVSDNVYQTTQDLQDHIMFTKKYSYNRKCTTKYDQFHDTQSSVTDDSYSAGQEISYFVEL